MLLFLALLVLVAHTPAAFSDTITMVVLSFFLSCRQLGRPHSSIMNEKELFFGAFVCSFLMDEASP